MAENPNSTPKERFCENFLRQPYCLFVLRVFARKLLGKEFAKRNILFNISSRLIYLGSELNSKLPFQMTNHYQLVYGTSKYTSPFSVGRNNVASVMRMKAEF